ncbi:hypothetical protein F511_23029 [Dorcoceras hygrometricum]|uniref:Uncharacterized protein n=1 Tax=Dorcoceras hygrometricum TaxID=472368 RepID=A0A2Z7CRS6_9LAMI|nr:hypothetical protein F511_23029 [Dorcoceras hygrometricum]
MKRRRVEESADGLALMTSSVTSSYSADGLREQSQESAGSLYIQTQEEATFSRKTLRRYPVARSSRELQCCCIFSRLGTQTQEKKKQAKYRDSTSRELQISSRKKADVAKHCNQAQSFQSTKISAEDEFSRSEKSAAKQLTTYEEVSKLDVNC